MKKFNFKLVKLNMSANQLSSTLENKSGVYLADRGDKFKTLITNVLKRGIKKEKYLKLLTNEESIQEYSRAFTSESVDENYNYQVYEQLGDLTGNKFIVWYFYRRFPQLKCTKGVKVVARLRINYGAKQSFYKIAQKLGFWDFISATNDTRQRKMKPLLEDVFEAFLGVTESLLDEVKFGTGYIYVYRILKSIFDEMDISLKYEDLYDAKTRLKELSDMFGENMGPIVYKEEKKELITYSTVYRILNCKYAINNDGTLNLRKYSGGQMMKIGEGSAALKSDAQQYAAKQALYTLNKMGFVKNVPEIYQRFAEGKGEKQREITTESLKKEMGETIDTLLPTKRRTKYQSKYESTLLAKYCRKRNLAGVKECLKMNANPDILDTDGLSPLDLLFIGKKEENIVRKIMEELIKAESELEMLENIYENYYKKYCSDNWFKKQIGKLTLIVDEEEDIEK